MTVAMRTGSQTATSDARIPSVIELLDTLFGFRKRFRPRSESAPGPLERCVA